MKRFSSLFLLLAAATAFAAGKPPTFSPALLSAEDRVLSSDAFEGRAPATPGEEKTVAYVIAQMKAAVRKSCTLFFLFRMAEISW